MIKILPQSLISLAERCPTPLYAVGGSVRDFLRGATSEHTDWDIAGAMTEEQLLLAAKEANFTVAAVYRNTGTVRLHDENGVPFEFTRFRSDKYVRGVHSPAEITFTSDIATDAIRRDFTANAVYYDVASRAFVDPLNGIPDIQKGVFRTVAPAKKVFGEDGLRLMRLARLSAETGFMPDEECLAGATEHAALILDIVPERIFAELTRLLAAPEGERVYQGLLILKQPGVLAYVMPELAAGDKLFQRADFHSHDVLEHSLRCAMYAPPQIRFAALLHDVGKPFCFARDGNFYDHASEGARLAGEILTRLKAPKKLTEETKKLVLLHMRDFNLQMRESKVRRTIVENNALIDKLLALFQADFSACKDNLSPAPAVLKWQRIAREMQEEGAPRRLKELNVNGDDLKQIGIPAPQIKNVLHELLFYAAENGSRNQKDLLLKHVIKIYKGEA